MGKGTCVLGADVGEWGAGRRRTFCWAVPTEDSVLLRRVSGLQMLRVLWGIQMRVNRTNKTKCRPPDPPSKSALGCWAPPSVTCHLRGGGGGGWGHYGPSLPPAGHDALSFRRA